MVGVTTIKEIPSLRRHYVSSCNQNKLKTKQKKQNTNFGTDCLRNIVFAKVTATDMTVITNLSFYDRKDFLWTALPIYFPPSVHVCTLSFDDALRYMYYTAQLNFTCCTWFTCCSVSRAWKYSSSSKFSRSAL